MPEERKVYRRPARTAAPAPQAGQTAPRPDAPPPPKKKKRPGAKRRRSRLVLGLCLLCLLVVVIVSVVLVRCSAEEKGPAEADFGTPAAAWQKNDLGYYFNTSGRAMPAAVLKGMDVSKFQGEIDWEKAKAAGIDFAIIRCGFGGEWDGQEENWAQDDPQWRRNADECTRLGIPFGAYLYSYATTVEEAQQPRDVVGLAAGLLHRRCVGVEIGAERDAQPGAFIGIAPPLRVILRPVFLGAVPLTAEAAADDCKVDTGRLGGLPVDLSLKFGDIHTLQHRRRDRPAAGVEVVAQLVFLPCGGRRAEVSLGRAAGFRRAAHHHNGHHQHDRQA